jgi:hypothetical protein
MPNNQGTLPKPTAPLFEDKDDEANTAQPGDGHASSSSLAVVPSLATNSSPQQAEDITQGKH